MILKPSPALVQVVFTATIVVSALASEPQQQSKSSTTVKNHEPRLLRGDRNANADRSHHRSLQVNCSSYNDRRKCKRTTGCDWDNQTCKSTATPAPTPPPTPCPGGTSALQVTVLTDNYPLETTWSLTNVCTYTTLWTNSDEGTLAASTSYSHGECVEPGRYTFDIADSYGDGICCSYGSGGYTVSYLGEAESGGSFDRSGSQSVGSCGPITPEPTKSPTALPTKSPTGSPTIKPTASPTKNPTKVPTNTPTTPIPTMSPTKSPSRNPTKRPTVEATLTNQIICGYQGWYTFPGDGAPINKWKHWFNSPTNATHTDVKVDLYPTTDEYDEADMKESNILMKDGTYAKFYSAARPKVVLKHFEWMETYGISGVFHMRFMESLQVTNNRKWKTMVLNNVKSAAEATGRVFAVSYNIAGNTLDDSVLDDLKTDWMRLVDEEKITQSDRYIRQGGLPVLRIYGIGFKAVKVADTAKMASLIDWFQNVAEPQYRVFLIGGVPSRWRERINDSREEIEWKGIYESLDGLHPWHVGRFSHLTGLNSFYNNVIVEDANHCADRGILYMPTMWPGFSWHNLKNGAKPVNDIPRQGGNFMWQQAYKLVSNPKINTIWMAQFDETDESTAIFKVTAKTSDLPAEGTWLALDADGHTQLPSDWYLRLAGEAQKMLDGSEDVTSVIPITP